MIKFDLDGTLVDIQEKFDHLIGLDGYKKIRPQTHFQFKTEPEMTDSQMWEYFFKVYAQWPTTRIFDGAHELMQTLWLLTADPIHIITARPGLFAKETYGTIKRIMKGIPFTMALVDASNDKLAHLNPDDILVEDRRQTVLHLAGAGVRSIIIDKEYNYIKHEHRIPEIIARVSGVHKIIPMLPYLLSA